MIFEEYAADPLTALFEREPPVEKSGRSGRKRRDLPDLLFEFLVLFRQEAGGSPPSATWRRRGANEYRDTSFATTVAKLLKCLPRLSKPASLPDHLRVPLSAKTISSRIAELKYLRRPKRASRRRSERREIHLKTA